MGNLLRALKQKQGASSIDSFSDLSLSLRSKRERLDGDADKEREKAA